MLEGEQLTKQAAKVHAPTLAIAEAVSALTTTPLSSDQRVIVDRLVSASEGLRAVAVDLPMPPQSGRPHRN
jgi:hypothetical protein